MKKGTPPLPWTWSWRAQSSPHPSPPAKQKKEERKKPDKQYNGQGIWRLFFSFTDIAMILVSRIPEIPVKLNPTSAMFLWCGKLRVSSSVKKKTIRVVVLHLSQIESGYKTGRYYFKKKWKIGRSSCFHRRCRKRHRLQLKKNAIRRNSRRYS